MDPAGQVLDLPVPCREILDDPREPQRLTGHPSGLPGQPPPAHRPTPRRLHPTINLDQRGIDVTAPRWPHHPARHTPVFGDRLHRNIPAGCPIRVEHHVRCGQDQPPPDPIPRSRRGRPRCGHRPDLHHLAVAHPGCHGGQSSSATSSGPPALSSGCNVTVNRCVVPDDRPPLPPSVTTPNRTPASP